MLLDLEATHTAGVRDGDKAQQVVAEEKTKLKAGILSVFTSAQREQDQMFERLEAAALKTAKGSGSNSCVSIITCNTGCSHRLGVITARVRGAVKKLREDETSRRQERHENTAMTTALQDSIDQVPSAGIVQV